MVKSFGQHKICSCKDTTFFNNVALKISVSTQNDNVFGAILYECALPEILKIAFISEMYFRVVETKRVFVLFSYCIYKRKYSCRRAKVNADTDSKRIVA